MDEVSLVSCVFECDNCTFLLVRVYNNTDEARADKKQRRIDFEHDCAEHQPQG